MQNSTLPPSMSSITDEQLAEALADLAAHPQVAEACFWSWWPQPHYAEDANEHVLRECIEAEQRSRAALAAADDDQASEVDEWWSGRLAAELDASMRRIHDERARCEIEGIGLPDWAVLAA